MVIQKNARPACAGSGFGKSRTACQGAPWAGKGGIAAGRLYAVPCKSAQRRHRGATDGYPARNDKIGKAAAVGESLFPDGSDTVWQGQACQALAVVKC